MLEVTIVPNQRRPGVGLPPRSEPRRAWLPQQSRFCPVVEDGNRLGVLVYPPLENDETLQVRFIEGGAYRFSFHKGDRPVFTIVHRASAVGGAAGTDELLFFDEQAGLRRGAIKPLLEALTVNIGGLHGGIGLRGAYDFVTPDGWDTIYTGVLNDVQRPHVPSLTVRVETDWFTQPTEFRYALEVGDGISASGITPIGQVFFVPREPLALTPATEEQRQRFASDLERYWGDKPQHRQVTAYGGIFDHQYRLESRSYEAGRAPVRPAYTPSEDAQARPVGASDEGVEAPTPPRAPHPSDRQVREQLQRKPRNKRR